MGQQLDKNICCNQAENTSKPLIEQENENNHKRHNKHYQQQQSTKAPQQQITNDSFLNQQQNKYSPQQFQKKQRPQQLKSNTKQIIVHEQTENNDQENQYQLQNQQNQQQANIKYQQIQYQQQLQQQQKSKQTDMFQQQKQYLEKNTDPYFIEQTQQQLYDKERKSLQNVNQSITDDKENTGNQQQQQEELAQRIQQLKQLTSHAPKLQLTILSSATLKKGMTLNINCQGFINSLRQEQDGYTYFGCKKRQFRSKPTDYYEKNGFNVTSTQNLNLNFNQTNNQLIDSDDEEYQYNQAQIQQDVVNDFIIPSQDPLIADRHRGTHFQIEYNIQQNNYKIKDLGIGFGAFYKLDFPLILKNNHLINIGLIFMVVNFVNPKDHYEYNNNFNTHQYLSDPEDYIDNNSDQEEEEDEDYTNDDIQIMQQQQQKKKDLKIKFFGGPCQGEKIIYKAKNNRVITIGRSKDDCKPYLQDNLLSKVQCQIEYSDKIGWVINDGKSQQENNYNSQSTSMQSHQQQQQQNSQQQQRTHSTNGTWLYLGEEYSIYNGMIFKANQTLFQASII